MMSKNSTPPQKEDVQQMPSEPPQGYFIPLSTQSQEDEIDLFELWNVLWSRRKMIIALTTVAAILSIIISLLIPNQYSAELVMAPVAEEKVGGLASALGGLGGLASMAGVSLGGGGSTEQNLAVLESREFLWTFIKDNQLIPILFADDWNASTQKWRNPNAEEQPTLWDAYRTFDEMLATSIDKNSGLITISIEWINPAQAAKWTNELLERLNNHLRAQAIGRSNSNLKYLNEELARIEVADMRQTLFELISKEQKSAMLANTQKEFAFRVIDSAVEPDKKSKPKRALIVILATILGGMLAIFIAFIQHAIAKRNDESVAQQQD